ncbi:MAG: sigma-70 family RNA polymerase sigma factor [Acidimicrobiia bacterium]|nr:sigma-70 family RNA polymerase sigma factor [Acidimicrobiia bacterium]MBT8217753.1 sigma-70 family RNA polymerase sigma factor [Acidimicrobiia bacterium]NNL71632.1 sigma-70 family RNA polymerase sigma factor [Acidimicrobiia bacterium]
MVARTESETAFARLYEEYGGRVLAYCVRRLPRDDARDAAAEVFAVAWRKFDDVPRDEGAIRWLYGVARNVVKNHRRSRRRSDNLVTKLVSLRGDGGPGPEAHVIERDEHKVVREAIQRLRPKYREVLQLVEWEGLSRNDAADVLHLSRAAIDQRMHRAYLQLEQDLSAASTTQTERGGA